MLLLDLDGFKTCGGEVDLQSVDAVGAELLRHVKSMRDEHVVALQDSFSIELDSSEGVETVKREYMYDAFLRLRYLGQLDFVGPSLVRYPFCFKFIEAQEGIWNSSLRVSSSKFM